MELKEVTYEVLATGDKMPSGYYLKADVDTVLAEKDKEIALLKERICDGDVSRATWIDDCFDKDKEIAELKADYKEACGRLQTANLIKDEQLAATRHHKFKRCLAMAELCGNACDKWMMRKAKAIELGKYGVEEYHRARRKLFHYMRWQNRWLELAEKI